MLTPTSARRGSSKKRQGQGWMCTACPATHKGQPLFPDLKATMNHERSAHGHEPLAVEIGKNANGADGVRTREKHLETADETCWDKIDHPRLTSEGLRQWEMHAHVDHVFDLVPFWQRGIDAAEKGQVLRLEEFLEKMEGDGGWRTTKEVLGMLGVSSEAAWGQPYQDDWAASQREAWEPNTVRWAASHSGGWGAASTRIASDVTESSRGRDSEWGVRDAWVEGGPGLNKGRGAVQDGWTRPRVKVVGAVRGNQEREELHHFVDAIARQEAVNEERRKAMHLFFEMPMEQKIQKIKETIRFLRAHAV